MRQLGSRRTGKSRDEAILARLEKADENIVEAFRQGVQGPAWDQDVLVRPWGFRLENITTEINVWQSDRDVMVPLPMGQYSA